MRQKLFTIVSLLSLLLCFAAMALWVRGKWRTDVLILHTPFHETLLISIEGRLQLVRLTWDFTPAQWMLEQGWPAPAPAPGWHFDRDGASADDAYEWTGCAGGSAPDNGMWEWHAFGGYADGHPPQYNSESPPFASGWSVHVPDWFLVLAFAIAPLARIAVAARYRERLREGRCPGCGYDLRASPDQCPECGAVRST